MSSLEYHVALAKKYKDNWHSSRGNIENARIEYLQQEAVSCFAERVSSREDTGADLMTAWYFLLDRVRTTERAMDWGLLETSLVCDTHRVMFHKTSFPNGTTSPGQLSHRPRYCNLRGGVRHWYPVPDDMSEALGSLLDRFNARYDSCRDMYDLALFRTCAWLISHFLALHPFADGNGRLAQILCSYVLAEHQPFPVPVCDADHYLSSLLKAQSTGNVDALAACVAQSSCHGWKKFIDFL